MGIASAALLKKRQVSLPVPFDDWKTLELAASALRKPVTHLILELLEPGLRKLQTHPPTRDDDE